MTKPEVEQIADMVEQMLLMSKRIIQTRENWISFFPVSSANGDGYNLAHIATSLANKAMEKGFVSLKTVKRSFNRRSYLPNEAFEVERRNFKIAAFVYFRQKETHLMLVGK